VVLRPKKVGNRKTNVKSAYELKKKNKQILCLESELDPPKDRAVHEGDNPSF
jgi:hypothetical protein